MRLLICVRLARHVEAARCAPCPSLGSSKPAQHPDDRGFARAVRPEEAEDGTLGDREGNVIHGREMAEPFGQPLAFDHQFACHEKARSITSPKSNPPSAGKPA